MRYAVKFGRRRTDAWIVTSDAIVVWSSPAMRWAVGLAFEKVDRWCWDRGIYVAPTKDRGQRPVLTKKELAYLRKCIEALGGADGTQETGR